MLILRWHWRCPGRVRWVGVDHEIGLCRSTGKVGITSPDAGWVGRTHGPRHASLVAFSFALICGLIPTLLRLSPFIGCKSISSRSCKPRFSFTVSRKLILWFGGHRDRTDPINKLKHTHNIFRLVVRAT